MSRPASRYHPSPVTRPPYSGSRTPVVVSDENHNLSLYMEFRHFRYALAIAEEGSFTRAAERLHVAQQGLSQQIADLERELGVRLFERLPRGVHLTPAGRAFLTHARAILVESASAIAEARSLVSGLCRRLRVGFPPFAAPETDALIAHFRGQHPGIQIELDRMLSRNQAAALQDGNLDVALGFMPTSAAGIAEEAVATAVMGCVFLPAGHPLAGRGTVWLSELAPTPMLMTVRESNPYAYDRILAQLEDRGLRPELSDLRVHGAPTVSLVAVAGAWLLWFDGAEPTAGTVRCGIADPPLTLEVWLLWRQDDHSPLVDQFVSSCRERVRPRTAAPLAG